MKEKKTILVTGAKGFVGNRLMQELPGALAAPSLRNASEAQISNLLDTVQPDVIIHTAAISDIPTCAAMPEESYLANVLLPERLAKCNRGAKLVFFSSDQVYSGLKTEGPYTETETEPGNLYAQQKMEMEKRVLDVDSGAVLLRAEWMYDWASPKGNYIRNVLLAQNPLHFSSRQYRGVTYLKEVVLAMEAVMQIPGGAYNFGSETDKSMYEITRQFLRQMGKDTPVLDCEPRHNLWMDCTKAKNLGVQFSSVSEGLVRCAQDYSLMG